MYNIVIFKYTYIPPADDSDFPPPSQMPYVKRRTSSILSKWTKLQRLLKEREQQLEMSSGSMQEYLEYLQNLLDWIDRELKQDSLVATPPAHAQLLKGYLDQLQVSEGDGLRFSCRLPLKLLLFLIFYYIILFSRKRGQSSPVSGRQGRR